MSHSVDSYLVYGMKVPYEVVRKNKKVRVCNHEITEEMNFCPTCGKPSYKNEDEDILSPIEKD